jgi:hypothetical protein
MSGTTQPALDPHCEVVSFACTIKTRIGELAAEQAH